MYHVDCMYISMLSRSLTIYIAISPSQHNPQKPLYTLFSIALGLEGW